MRTQRCAAASLRTERILPHVQIAMGPFEGDTWRTSTLEPMQQPICTRDNTSSGVWTRSMTPHSLASNSDSRFIDMLQK